MTVLVDSSLKVAVIVLLSLGVAVCLRRRAAAARHWVLAVGIACAIAVPGLALVVPSWPIAIRGTASAPPAADAQSSVTTIITQNASWGSGAAAAGIAAAPPVADRTDARRLIALVWFGGAAIIASILLVGLVRLRVVAAAAQPVGSGPWRQAADEMARDCGLRRPIVLLQSNHPTLLVTWGWRRPRVILPAAARLWTTERARIVLCHELAHIRRGDWTAQILGELLRSLYWFNPIVWIACRRLRRESEQACDDAVLQSGVDPTEYASHLLDLARTLNAGRRAHVPAPAMARRSSLEGRISAMLNARLDRRPPTRAVQAAIAAVLLAATLSIAGAAQARYSTFSGTVVDQTNGFLPNTTMVLTNAASRARYEVRTDATGRFEFVGLPPGEYTLQATQMGFAALTEPVAITGRDLSRTIQLQVGSLQETITLVSGPATPAKVDPERAEKLQALRDKAQERQLRATQHCASATGGGVGGNILQPWKIKDVKPIYPEAASSTRVGGVVTMDALIGTDGTVREVSVISSPDPDLDRAAAEAVRQWEFTPTILNCTAIDVRMKVTANFVVRQ